MPYNEENRSGRWYIPAGNLDHPETGSWYCRGQADPEPPPAESAPAEEPVSAPEQDAPAAVQPSAPDKDGHKKARVIALAVCCAVIVAAVFFALGRACSVQTDRRPAESASGEMDTEDLLPRIFDSLPYEDDDTSPEDYFNSYYSRSDAILIPPAETGTGVTLTLAPTQGPELSLQDIYTKVNPSVVAVLTYVDGYEYAWGTGVVFTSDGYIVTNAHIIEGAETALIRFPDGREFDAFLVGSDTATDLAVLKVEGEDLPYAEFADSALCRVGDSVVAIGNPLSEAYSGTMTNGIISGMDRSLRSNGYTMTLLQTNAALNEGNSGGPLINMHGQVIGITSMKIMYSYTSTVEGLGFAIPSSVVKTVVDQLVENGIVPGKPALGIVAGAVSSEAMSLYDLPQGVYVTEVHENSDAHRQGLRVGDVITAVNGVPVSTVAEVNAVKEGLAVGDTITAEVYRDGRSFEIEFALVDNGLVQ